MASCEMATSGVRSVMTPVEALLNEAAVRLGAGAAEPGTGPLRVGIDLGTASCVLDVVLYDQASGPPRPGFVPMRRGEGMARV